MKQKLIKQLFFFNISEIFRMIDSKAKVRYPLDEILLLVLLAVIAGADDFVAIAAFDEEKRDFFLRRFLPFKDAAPSHDHLGDIFAKLDSEKFQKCFVILGCQADRHPE